MASSSSLRPLNGLNHFHLKSYNPLIKYACNCNHCLNVFPFIFRHACHAPPNRTLRSPQLKTNNSPKQQQQSRNHRFNSTLNINALSDQINIVACCICCLVVARAGYRRSGVALKSKLMFQLPLMAFLIGTCRVMNKRWLAFGLTGPYHIIELSLLNNGDFEIS